MAFIFHPWDEYFEYLLDIQPIWGKKCSLCEDREMKVIVGCKLWCNLNLQENS